MNNLSSIGNFIEKSNQKQNNKYDYSKFIYSNNNTKGIIICPKHGEFLCNPDNHLKNLDVVDVKKCQYEKLSNITTSKVQKEFLDFLHINCRNVSINNTIFIVDGYNP